MTQPSASTRLARDLDSPVDEFRPHLLLRNPHIQTILASWYPGRVAALPIRPRLVALPDGDALVMHDSVPAKWSRGGPAALLIHGLGGNYRSGYMQRIAAHLVACGVRAVRLDLRGCGRGERFARKIYNGACSDDVRQALAAVAAWAPGSPVALVGFSLGGNIALKLTGETPEYPVANLGRVAAVAPPIDMERCADLLAQKRNRLYEWHFVRALVGQVRRQEQHFPEDPQTRLPRRLSLRQFDDLYTAPRGGFRDALDYYRRASSLRLISRITVPALIVTSRDDPFIAVEPFEQIKAGGPLELHILRHGGHLGFFGNDGAGGMRWLEQRLVAWILRGAVSAGGRNSIGIDPQSFRLGRAMPRYVILEHDHPRLHWDLMLDTGATLRTWRLAAPPEEGQQVEATLLGDHRRMYLDYEGPVSGGRGQVKRWDRGAYQGRVEGPGHVVVEVQGERLFGRVLLAPSADGGHWVLSFAPG